jgi:hypothetical protein
VGVRFLGRTATPAALPFHTWLPDAHTEAVFDGDDLRGRRDYAMLAVSVAASGGRRSLGSPSNICSNERSIG